MMLADSLLTKTTISTALAFKGSHASAFGYLAKVFQRLFFGCIVSVLLLEMLVIRKFGVKKTHQIRCVFIKL